MTDLETAHLMGALTAKLEAIHDDVRELKLQTVPDGQRRLVRVENKIERTVYGFGALLVGLATLIGDRIYAFLPFLGGR